MKMSEIQGPPAQGPCAESIKGQSVDFHLSRHEKMSQTPANEFVTLNGESYIAIRNVDSLEPFFMSLVSDSDHWLFVGSNGPFSAGRVDPDHAVFPYQTVDKILRHDDTSGSLTIIQIKTEGKWKPWRSKRRNLYKHVTGTSLIFEEGDDGLRFRWSLTTCEPYGFVRECSLENLSGEPVELRILDGWHQILTPTIGQRQYGEISYLVAAYMFHEALPDSLALYKMNASLTDRAEAAECLRVACAWSLGHENPTLILSDRQVKAFRQGLPILPEKQIRGEMGSYLVCEEMVVRDSVSWVTVIDTGLDHAGVVGIQEELKDPERLRRSLQDAIRANREGLRRRIAAADGLQASADQTMSTHHFANVLFNCMRGGTFADGYAFPTSDFIDFVRIRNRVIFEQNEEWLASLPSRTDISALKSAAQARGCEQLARLAAEYLPLTFSRRHGDPSRPWNRFNIRLKDEYGNPIYSYQGNWRDIFQNWESLAQSYPLALESMVSIFLNASTADGYNPYRIGREGIDWEVPEPDNPWSHIGYWGDHQIIYLLRLLESLEKFNPGTLKGKLSHRGYAYAEVPYVIGDFEAICRDPRNSITFNWQLHKLVTERAKSLGSDGKLKMDEGKSVLHVSLAEKLLVPALVKLTNLVPGGGIWLNTQRPEWNDANNALAGWGLSMVTVSYLRRYLTFLFDIFADQEVEVSLPVASLLNEVTAALEGLDVETLEPESRLAFMERVGRSGAAHRSAVYQNQFGDCQRVNPRKLFEAALPALDQCIATSRREDGLFHSYSVLHLEGKRARVEHLAVMLEGQVAALSSRALELEEVIHLLESLRKSQLYRENQRSYLLYPDQDLVPFMERNTLLEDPPLTEKSLFTRDQKGKWHFQADLRNASDLESRLEGLAIDGPQKQEVLQLWEKTFNHSKFTGRSGTMFMFEGLGSIYWHMVAKLLLAVQENYEKYRDPQIAKAYHEIRDGLGFRKTPQEYGAFPTDPYSHTPGHRGAQQPGMTGQVKEEILTRLGELGVSWEGGCLSFAPSLLCGSEFYSKPHIFSTIDVEGRESSWELPEGSLAFTVCQVPVCYQVGGTPGLRVEHSDGRESSELSIEDCQGILARNGKIRRIWVSLKEV